MYLRAAQSGLCKRVRFLRGLRIWVGHGVIVYNEPPLDRWARAHSMSAFRILRVKARERTDDSRVAFAR